MTKTYIFDIDNTLCHTWPTLSKQKGYFLFRFFEEAWRVSFIPCLNNMMRHAQVRKIRHDSEVYFLSARHWSLWPFTYIYLVRHIGLFSPHRLTLVPSASEKVKNFEAFLNSREGLITVIDDLSYNTEAGHTLYYSDIIQYLRSQPRRIRYIAKDKIDLINNSPA